MASPAGQPEVAVSADGIAHAINNGTTLAAAANNAEDYLKFAQGVQTLADAFVNLHEAEHGPVTPPGGAAEPGGNRQAPPVEQG
jgi:hypothetical protein